MITHHEVFGKSLDINILGRQKVCSFDCLYCDLGPSTLTMNAIRRKHSFPSIEDLLSEIRGLVAPHNDTLNTLILSGNGEPTLYPDFHKLAEALVELRNELIPNAKLVALTNGAHLDSKKVVAGLNLLDERLLKVDAGNDAVLKKINVPLVRMTSQKLYSGARLLSDCIVQSMFVDGEHKNCGDQALEEWMEVVGIIQPKSVVLFTASRKPRDPSIVPLSEDDLYSIAFKLKKKTQLEARVLGYQAAS